MSLVLGDEEIPGPILSLKFPPKRDLLTPKSLELRFLVAVVQTGPRRGFFLSVENLIDKTQRIFRNWLAERAETTEEPKKGASDDVTNFLGCKADEILWIDLNKIVGLRVRVEERKGRKDLPILLHKDEDQAISYTLELQGKRLH